MNEPTTVRDAINADTIYGANPIVLKGSTKQRPIKPVKEELVQHTVQKEQILLLDIFYVKGLAFLSGLLLPLDLIVACHLVNKTATCVANGIHLFLTIAMKRGFVTTKIKIDGEGGIKPMEQELAMRRIPVETLAADEHAS